MQIPGHCPELPTRDRGLEAQEPSSKPGPGGSRERRWGRGGPEEHGGSLSSRCFLLHTPPLRDLVPGPERATAVPLWD